MTKIYIIHNIINNIKYIGQTSKSLNNRMMHHKSNITAGKTRFAKALNEIGFENFYIELIEEVDDDISNQRELYWIKKYKESYELYNDKISLGKCGGDTLSNHYNIPEISKKISDSKLLDKNPNSKKIYSINIKTKEMKKSIQ